jgi:hypothetical protein
MLRICLSILVVMGGRKSTAILLEKKVQVTATDTGKWFAAG